MSGYIQRVYVAGPMTPRGMRADTDNPAVEYLYNMRDMIRAGAELIENGYSPYVPGLDYHFFLTVDITESRIKDVSMHWLEASDAVLVLEHFDNSYGVIAELNRATELGIPIFCSVSEINEYMKGRNRG